MLALRHFEQLSRAEIAQVFGISEAAAGKRYIRALERLKQILGTHRAAWKNCGHERAIFRIRSGRRSGRGVPGAIPPGRAAVADRIHREASRAGRADSPLFPALMVMEELGSAAGPERPSRRRPGRRGDPMPQRLGDYLLLRPIGSGGMGVVYEAIQESLGRHVALKTLPFHHLGDPTRLERFRREARAAARLHHTHIVPVFGIGEHDGLHYYTMQFIRGHGLDTVLHEVKRLRRDPSEPRAAEAAAGQALSTTLALGLRTGRLPSDENGKQTIGCARRLAASSRPRAGPCSHAAPSAASSDRSELSDQPEAQYLQQRGAGSAFRSPRPWNTPTSRAFSIATSSPPTSCWTPRARSGSPTSDWPRPRTATS